MAIENETWPQAPLSIRDLAEKYGLSETFIRSEVRSKRLKAHRLGTKILRVMPEDWDAWMRARDNSRGRA